MTLKEILKKYILVLDGAFGTMVQQKQLDEAMFRGDTFASHPCNLQGCNDVLNLSQPELVQTIHEQYLSAGADIIKTNTFNATPVGLKEYQLNAHISGINQAGVKIAREALKNHQRKNSAKPKFIAGVIGPTNKTASLSPHVNQPGYREISFDDLHANYYTQVEALGKAGVDMFLLETIFDTLNAKAALTAINTFKRNSGKDLPVMVSLTITDASGRTLTGQTLDAFVYSILQFNPTSVGLNCSFGAEKLLPYLDKLSKLAPVYTSAHPNAGLPNEIGEYDQSAMQMAGILESYLQKKLVNIIGGCCGSTPEHIAAIADKARLYAPRQIPDIPEKTCLSGLEALSIPDKPAFINIGERTNVMGSRKFLRLIREEKYEEALTIAREQVEAGAHMININLDEGMLDTPKLMPEILNLLVAEPEIARVPVMIDSSNFSVLENGLKCLPGKSVVNSLSLKEGEADFLRNAKRIKELGAALVVMAFDERGQAVCYERKIAICKRAYDLLVNQLQFSPYNIIFDPNVLTVATGIEDHNDYAVDFLKAVKWIKENLPGARVTGGVSNVSFAFRGNDMIRDAMNSVFVHLAHEAGMDMGIVNPSRIFSPKKIPLELKEAIEDVLLNSDEQATERLTALAGMYKNTLSKKAGNTVEWRNKAVEDRLIYAIEKGIADHLKQDIHEKMDKSGNPLGIIEGPLMKGMNNVGEAFGEGRMFLPQVVKSARIMKKAVSIIMPYIIEDDHQAESHTKGKILLATVKGDVHDIGKNILSLILKCNNYKVIDLGVMVSNEEIIHAIHAEKPDIIGVSGLITPSLEHMESLAQLMEKKQLKTPLLLGGATTSPIHTAVKVAPNYSGITIQVPDASQSINIINKLMSKDKAIYIEQFRMEQKQLAENHLTHKKGKRKHLPIGEARQKRFTTNWDNNPLVRPRFIGSRKFENYSLNEIKEFIDWTPFFHGWGMKGLFPFILEKDKVGESAKRVFEEGEAMLKEIIEKKLLTPRGIIGLFPANSQGDDIIVFKDDERNEVIDVLPMLRQQELRDKSGKCLSLSDYIAPIESGRKDYIGTFAVTTGHEAEKHVNAYKENGDSYNSIMFRLLADRLTEAFAELLHLKVRKDYWGYDPDENLNKQELFKEKFRGIRPAPGYPACPDHTLKKHLFELLNVEENIGISLTESYAMRPASSITGLFIAHNESRYFGVGKVNKDQVADYASRKRFNLREAEKWLRPVLNYKTK